MGAIDWIGHNWFTLVQTGGIIAALAGVAFGFFYDARSRRVANLIALTDRHRELWERMNADPKLARILDPTADPERMRITPEEELFVIFLILHLANTYYTVRSGFLKQPHGLARDVQIFFTLPIPRAVWHQVRDLQDRPFVRFVESALATPGVASGTTAADIQPRPRNTSFAGQTTKGRRRP